MKIKKEMGMIFFKPYESRFWQGYENYLDLILTELHYVLKKPISRIACILSLGHSYEDVFMGKYECRVCGKDLPVQTFNDQNTTKN